MIEVSPTQLDAAINAFAKVIEGVDAQQLPDGIIDADRIALLAMRELRERRSHSSGGGEHG